jgi:transcriptional regulator with XRE-family HTH domain
MDEQTIIDYKAIGAKFKQKRLQLGLTQEKIAEKLDIEESYYSRIENGNRVLSVETLVKLAAFYDVSVDWLLLDSTFESDDKLMVEIDAIFRDKSPSESALLLNLLKIQSENIRRLLS